MNFKEKQSDKINEFIIDFIGNNTRKKTPADIVLIIKTQFKIKRKEIKNILKDLISKGELEYLNIFGRSFIDISFSKPVRISENIVLKPPGINFKKNKNDIVIIIEKGISFGRGTHPTTRLSLQGIDFLLNNKKQGLENTKALDIGTGSGVLAIAGALSGIGEVYGSDLDLISVSEAQNNVKHNKLEKTISINDNFDKNKIYDFIFANLRFPTLIDLYNELISLTKIKSYLIFSGIKTEEKEKIINKYSQGKFEKIWEQSESGWVGLIFKRK